MALLGLLTVMRYAALAAMCTDGARLRSRIVMARHGFGQGEHQYFACLLPKPIATLRSTLWVALARSATGGTRSLASTYTTQRLLTRYLRTTKIVGKRSLLRRCCNTVPATTISCIRTCLASTYSRCRLCYFYLDLASSLMVASS